MLTANSILPKEEIKKVVVESFNTDFLRCLNYETLGKDILNCAEDHANKRGFGVDDVTPQNHAWVLSRLVIEMKEMPKMFTEFEITTWIECVYRLFTNRNFEIKEKDGKILGYARSIWAMIDRKSRQPIELEKIYGNTLNTYADKDRLCPIPPQTRLRPLKDVTCEKEYQIVASDIDYNNHVNSIKYIKQMYDMFSVDYYLQHPIKRIEVAYINESKFGDTLRHYKKGIEEGKYEIEIRNQKDEIVVRGMICF